MAGGYTRVVSFKGVQGEPLCVELPLPPRGKLERLIVTQIGATSSTDTVKVYDRKGACSGATDLNVRAFGQVGTVTDDNGKAAVTFNEYHGLLPGDTFEIKGNTQPVYNVIHTVTSVSSSKIVVTDVDYTAVGNSGVWQTAPYMVTNNPASHLVYTGDLAAGSLQDFDINRSYENRDNQSETMRSRYQALWLDITPAAAGDFEVSVTAEPITLF